jgi:hypothetical protein
MDLKRKLEKQKGLVEMKLELMLIQMNTNKTAMWKLMK